MCIIHTCACVCCILYCRRGPNKWRDQFLPVEILDEWIKAKGLPPAEWAKDGKSVIIGDQEYTLSHFGKHCNYNDVIIRTSHLHLRPTDWSKMHGSCNYCNAVWCLLKLSMKAPFTPHFLPYAFIHICTVYQPTHLHLFTCTRTHTYTHYHTNLHSPCRGW